MAITNSGSEHGPVGTHRFPVAQSLWKTDWKFLKKLPSYYPAIPFTGYLPKEVKAIFT